MSETDNNSDIGVITAEVIQQFSRNVYSGDFNAAMASCIDILHRFEVMGGYSTGVVDEKQATQALAFFAAGYTAMLANPGYSVTREGLGALMSHKTVLSRIFSSTDFRDMSYIYPLIGETQGGHLTLSERSLDKFVLATTLDIMSEDAFGVLRMLKDDAKLLFWLSLLDNKCILTETEQSNVARLIDFISELKVVPVMSIPEVDLVNRVWFVCSYWDLPSKHEVKKFLNKVLLATADLLGVDTRQSLSPIPTREKKKVLVVLELWRYNSAMHRCYAKAVTSLRRHFEVVALAKPKEIDERNAYSFDDVNHFSPTGLLPENVKIVQECAPDIIFYPSLGMSAMATHLAQLRLAPVQIMTMGHPASSFSTEMDYVVIEEDFLSDPNRIGEKILLLKKGAFSLTRPDFDTSVSHGEKSERDHFQIVVNSMYQKLTPGFLGVCSEIESRAEVPVYFHFLCGANVLSVKHLTDIIQEKLNAEVHEMLEYKRYFSIIADSDLQLTPFPFGNTNSFVDAMIAGVPTVCMDGPEMHCLLIGCLYRSSARPVLLKSMWMWCYD